MGYLDCEYNAVGKDKAGVIVKNNDSRIMGVLNGPFEPSGPIVNRYAGSIRVTVTGDSADKIEYGSLQESIEAALSEIVYLRDYSRCIIDVRLFVLERSSAIYSAIINAASILLMNAGIHMKGMLIGVTDTAHNSTTGYAYANEKYHKVLQIGEYTESVDEQTANELSDLLERIVYSLREDYRRDWLLR